MNASARIRHAILMLWCGVIFVGMLAFESLSEVKVQVSICDWVWVRSISISTGLSMVVWESFTVSISGSKLKCANVESKCRWSCSPEEDCVGNLSSSVPFWSSLWGVLA